MGGSLTRGFACFAEANRVTAGESRSQGCGRTSFLTGEPERVNRVNKGVRLKERKHGYAANSEKEGCRSRRFHAFGNQ